MSVGIRRWIGRWKFQSRNQLPGKAGDVGRTEDLTQVLDDHIIVCDSRMLIIHRQSADSLPTCFAELRQYGP
jgi:hypothetical protein